MPPKSCFQINILRKTDGRRIGTVRLFKDGTLAPHRGFAELPFDECEADIRKLVVGHYEKGPYDIDGDVEVYKL